MNSELLAHGTRVIVDAGDSPMGTVVGHAIYQSRSLRVPSLRYLVELDEGFWQGAVQPFQGLYIDQIVAHPDNLTVVSTPEDDDAPL